MNMIIIVNYIDLSLVACPTVRPMVLIMFHKKNALT